MTAKNGVVVSIVLTGMGITAWQLSEVRAASVAQITATAHAVTHVALAGNDSGYAYVGSKTCKMCHFKQYKSWSKGPHANALDILMRGHSADAKKAHGLDPNKDYTTDQKCVKCHVTGLGHAGGYKIGGDEKEMKDLVGVGCEMCHGAGEKYVEFHEQVMKEKKNYKQDEMYAVGMTKIGVDTCKKCHNEESPTFDVSKPFDYEERVKEGVHEHFDLKYRTE